MNTAQELEMNNTLLVIGFIICVAIFLFIFHAGMWFAESKVYSMPKIQKCI